MVRKRGKVEEGRDWSDLEEEKPLKRQKRHRFKTFSERIDDVRFYRSVICYSFTPLFSWYSRMHRITGGVETGSYSFAPVPLI